MKIARWFKFCAAHRLPTHAGKCRSLHGHSYRVRVVLSGEVDSESGMIVDFAELDSDLGRYVQDSLDHATILDRADANGIEGARLLGAKLLLIDEEPTSEAIARFLVERFSVLAKELWRLRLDSIRVCEGESGWVEASA